MGYKSHMLETKHDMNHACQERKNALKVYRQGRNQSLLVVSLTLRA